MSKVITFIGAGNMARGLILGLVNDNTDMLIQVVDPDENQLDIIRQYWPNIKVATEASALIAGSDVLVLAVKPQIMQMVCESLQGLLANERPLIISVAAGVKEINLNAWLGGGLAVVRCMPNTPALVQAAVSGLYANLKVSKEQYNIAETLLRAVGLVVWFDKEQSLDTVTAVSGSGPAYFFLVMESMQLAAEKMGLSAKEARLMVAQTAFGAAKLALESQESLTELRQHVTSKGGTTEAAINTMVSHKLPESIEKGMVAARLKAEELSLLSKDNN